MVHPRTFSTSSKRKERTDSSSSRNRLDSDRKQTKPALSALFKNIISFQDYNEDKHTEEDWDKINAKVDDLIKNEHHPRVFSELEEFHHTKENGLDKVEWKETARWVKFEEDVEAGGDRWSKPHVGTLSLHSFYELEKNLKSGGVFLDAEASSLEEVNEILLQYIKEKVQLDEAAVTNLRKQLSADHTHTVTNKKKNTRFAQKVDQGAEGCTILVGENYQIPELVSCFVRLKEPLTRTHLMEIDIPIRFLFIMVGPENSKNQFHEIGRCFATLMSDEVWHEVAYSAHETKDILLGMTEFLDKAWLLPPDEWDPTIRIDPPNIRGQNRRAEVTNRRFGQSQGVDFEDGGARPEEEHTGEELSCSRKFCGGLISDLKRKKPFYLNDFIDPFRTVTGALQCLATFIFLYFAVITPIITFGGLLGDATDNNIATMESLFGAAIAGGMYHLFCGQPLTIIGSTGPILVFESILYSMCQQMPVEYELSESDRALSLATGMNETMGERPLDYLELRWWVGVWTGFFCILIVVTDASACVKYITRYTEESFATLISVIFIVDGFKKMVHIHDKAPLNHHWRKEDIFGYNCYCDQPSYPVNGSDGFNTMIHTPEYWDNKAAANVVVEGNSYHPEITWANEDLYWCLYKNGIQNISKRADGTFFDFTPTNTFEYCLEQCGELVGASCAVIGHHNETVPFAVYVPDVYYFSWFLALGTLGLSFLLKDCVNTPFGFSWMRKFVSDFAVITAILLMVITDYVVGLSTPKLVVPDSFAPTRPDRGWFISPLNKNPAWTIGLAFPFALLATILIFMDQQITAVIVNRRENKLKKGCGYHLDLLIVALALIICSVMGLPWFVAATVLSITHVNSLKRYEGSTAPGEAPNFTGIYEQRVTGFLIFVLIGMSVLFTSVLVYVPLPVLYGVFIYMGLSSLKGNQFFDRMLLLLMTPKNQPDYVYLRHVPLRKVHLFTMIQVVCFAILYAIKSADHEIKIVFPIMVVAIVGVRKLFDYFPKLFTQQELSWLDDIMPQEHKKVKDNIRHERSRHQSAVSNGSNSQKGASYSEKGASNSGILDFAKPVNMSRTTSKAIERVQNGELKSRHQSGSAVKVHIKDLPTHTDDLDNSPFNE